MYLIPYQTPTAKSQATSVKTSPAKAVEVQRNDSRVWLMVYNRGASAVEVTLGSNTSPSFILAPGTDRLMPSPVYLGAISFSSKGESEVIVTEGVIGV